MVNRARQGLTPILGGLLGFAWFYFIVGHAILDPTQTTWLMKGDGAIHLLGWLFFRQAPWQFPWGAVPNLSYPLGTTVGFTDSIPWLAVAAKTISPILPVDFQYAGLWLGLCFFLQGFFGVKIVQILSANPSIQLMGGALFALDPLLIWRLGHTSLVAHWLVLGSVWLHLLPCPNGREPRGMLLMAIGFCALSAGIHPYLAVMVWGLTLALLWKWQRMCRDLTIQRCLGWSLVTSTTVLGIFTLFGYFGSGASLGGIGFGEFSADLLTLVNALAASRFLPVLLYSPGQYEGYGYLGTGVLWLGLLGLAVQCRTLIRVSGEAVRALTPLMLCCALFAVFALSSKLRLGGKVLFDVGFFYQPFMPIIAPFRVSGRFIWPLHYLGITGAIWLWTRSCWSSQRLLCAAFITAVLIQLVDGYTPFMRGYLRAFQHANPTLLRMDGWEYASGSYEHLVLYPVPMIDTLGGVCAMVTYDITDYAALGYKAYRLGLTFNGGYVARANPRSMRQYCLDVEKQIQAGRVSDRTIYVVHGSHWEHFHRHVPQATCGRIVHHIVCVSSQQLGAFRRVIESHSPP